MGQPIPKWTVRGYWVGQNLEGWSDTAITHAVCELHAKLHDSVPPTSAEMKERITQVLDYFLVESKKRRNKRLRSRVPRRRTFRESADAAPDMATACMHAWPLPLDRSW